MNKLLQKIGWKVGDKWDVKEVIVDVPILTLIMLVLILILK